MAKAVIEMFPGQQITRFSIGKVLGGIPAADTQWLPQKKTGGVNTWGLAFAIEPCKAYPMSALKRAMEAMLEADLALVTSSLDHRMVLHRLVVELIASKAPSRNRRAS